MPLEPGSVLNNRYRIIEILGQGGMGSVYRAIDENLGVEVAVKDNFFTTDEYARQFRREATILAGLRQANLPRVTDHFVIEGKGQYLVMDYIAGEDLRQRMDRLGSIPEEEAVKIGAAICDALSYLAACSPPIVHRDIKPGNVKIDPQGQIFLVDFGLAKILFGTQLTTTGARAMTPGYSPPEQYGSARTDQRTDLYSLGATLYAALTGCVPEDALNRAIEQVGLTPVRKLSPRIPRRLAGVIEKAMAIRPDDRYQSAAELKEALLNSLSNTRRNKDVELVIQPAPEMRSQKAPSDSTPLLVSPQSLALALPGGGSMTPASPPADVIPSRPASRPRRPARRRGRRLTFLLIVALLAGVVVVGLITLQQANNNLSWSTILYAIFSPTPNQPLAVTSTLAPGAVPSLTPAPSATQSPTSTQAFTATYTPIPTATFTPTTTPSLTPTPEPTQLGGSSGRLAYASIRDKVPQIWIHEISTGEERQVTNLPEGACQPDWSPDGHWLVFISPCMRNQETYSGSAMFLLNVETGGEPIPLPTAPGGDYDPRWSADGKKLLFTSERQTRRPRLYIMDIAQKTTTLVAETFERDYQPGWSPNGEQIVFVSIYKGVNEIWTMDANGSNRRQVTRSSQAVDSAPDWSPDGKVILFTQYNLDTLIPRLMALNIEETRPEEFQISPDNIPMREARYSTDGLWLVFESWPQGINHDIYIMTTNGANRRQVSKNPLNDFDGAWGHTAQP